MDLSRIIDRCRRFREDESGSITVETLIMLPILAWCYFGTFVFFDVFRAQSLTLKSSYTIGDALSRETGYVTNNYLNGLFNLQDAMLGPVESRALQITVYGYDEANDRFVVRWSRARGGLPQLTTATLANLRHRLPRMTSGEVAILTHARVEYEPLFEVGLSTTTFDEYTTTRPRFAPQLCWNTVENGGIATSIC